MTWINPYHVAKVTFWQCTLHENLNFIRSWMKSKLSAWRMAKNGPVAIWIWNSGKRKFVKNWQEKFQIKQRGGNIAESCKNSGIAPDQILRYVSGTKWFVRDIYGQPAQIILRVAGCYLQAFLVRSLQQLCKRHWIRCLSVVFFGETLQIFVSGWWKLGTGRKT